MPDQLVVDLLPGLPDIVYPRTVADEHRCGSRNFGHHLLAAGGLQHEVIVTVLFMLQSHDCGLDPPDGHFRDTISNVFERRWILLRILQARGTGKARELIDSGLDDAPPEVNSVYHVLAHLGSVRVLARLDRPTFRPGGVLL